jgi:hypothetical protein
MANGFQNPLQKSRNRSRPLRKPRYAPESLERRLSPSSGRVAIPLTAEVGPVPWPSRPVKPPDSPASAWQGRDGNVAPIPIQVTFQEVSDPEPQPPPVEPPDPPTDPPGPSGPA